MATAPYGTSVKGFDEKPRSEPAPGLLRIDLILSTDALLPQRTSIECPARGDHCLFQATIALTR